MKIIASLFMLILGVSCTSSHTASYRYTQKQIKMGIIDFDQKIQVDEYINAFPLKGLARPKNGDDISIKIDFFSNQLSNKTNKTLAQIAIRSRDANSAEKKQNLGYCFVLDISGSMTEDNKFTDAIEALLALVTELNDGDEFSLITFSSVATVTISPTLINAKNKELIKKTIGSIEPTGGTNISAGLEMGYKTLHRFQIKNNSRLLLLTDGQSNVGTTDPKEIAKEAGVQYLQNTRISTIGLGYEVDEQTLREIANKGNGAYYFAENSTALKDLFRKNLTSLMIPVASHVRLEIIPGKDTKINQIYGFSDYKPGQKIDIPIGELNSDDWRIYIAEIETSRPEAALTAKATFTPIGKKKTSMLTSQTILKSTSNKPEINKIVARNAVIFSNATSLIEVSKLYKSKKYKEAQDILTVQLTNLEVINRLDPSPELKKEQASLIKVQDIIQDAISDNQELESPFEEMNPESKTSRELLGSILSIAGKVTPGPWALVINLLEIFVK